MKSQVQAINEPPPRTWADYERGCVLTYHGGHEGKEAAAFAHGMRTVFRLLEEEFPPAEVCQAARDLLEACKRSRALYDEMSLDSIALAARYGPDYEPPSPEYWLAMRHKLELAIAKAENTPSP